MLAAVAVDRAGQQAEIPAAPAARIGDVEIQARRELPASRTRRGLGGDAVSHRQPQVDAEPSVGGAPQHHVERWAKLQRRLQVRHVVALVDVVAVDRYRRAGTEIELDSIAVEEDSAQAIAIGLQQVAAIDDIRRRQRQAALRVRTAIGREAHGADAETQFPQRLRTGLLRLHCPGQQRQRGQCLPPRQRHDGRSARRCPPLASISTSRSARQISACRKMASAPASQLSSSCAIAGTSAEWRM